MTHQNTFRRLLGKNHTPADREYYSLNNRVSATTPPTILLLSTNDRTVPPISSTLYYKALKHYGVKAAMHIYPEGGHGWVGRPEFRYDKDWKHQLKRWLEFINKSVEEKK
jgi:dipeptidyl aminopeptidase/acylaminoacyl peptidase